MRTIAFLISAFLVSPLLLHAQNNVGSIQPIIDEGLRLAKKIEEKDPSSEILKLEFDLAHDDNYTTLDLEKGKTYVFGAFGDERIVELSLIILKETRKGEYEEIYTKAIGADNATVRLEIPSAGHYAIDVQINEMKDEHELGHFGLIVCELKK